MSRKRYSPEFKEEAVRQVTERDYTVRDVAEKVGKAMESDVQRVPSVLEVAVNAGAVTDNLQFNKELSTDKEWWTLSQRIRTFAEIPFLVDLLEIEDPPVYQQIADNSLQLHKLGLSNEAIGRHYDVDGKTVAKALRWIRDKY